MAPRGEAAPRGVLGPRVGQPPPVGAVLSGRVAGPPPVGAVLRRGKLAARRVGPPRVRATPAKATRAAATLGHSGASGFDSRAADRSSPSYSLPPSAAACACDAGVTVVSSVIDRLALPTAASSPKTPIQMS